MCKKLVECKVVLQSNSTSNLDILVLDFRHLILTIFWNIPILFSILTGISFRWTNSMEFDATKNTGHICAATIDNFEKD